MHDPDYYPDPNRFDGLRYTRHRMRDDNNGERERENPMFGDAVTEVKREFPVWGFGGHVWFVFLSLSLPCTLPFRPSSHPTSPPSPLPSTPLQIYTQQKPTYLQTTASTHTAQAATTQRSC